MFKFIMRRLGISGLILLGASLLLFVLTINSGDPLEDLRESNAENRETLMAQRIRLMGLNESWYERYWDWLSGALQCFTLNCDLGTDRNGVSINALLVDAAAATLRLVILATVLALVIGIGTGIITAIRQYSGFDFGVTFGAFLFFSLPVFWAAVMLKEYGAIQFNDWMADPQMGVTTMVVIALLLAFIAQAVLGGDVRRRVMTAGVTGVFIFAALFYFDAVDWYRQPALGFGVVLLVSLGAAVLLTVLTTGTSNRRVMYGALTTVGAGGVSYWVFQGVLSEGGWVTLILLFVLAVAVATVIGWFWGGYSRKVAIWVSIGSATIMSLVIVADYALRAWAGYLEGGRPISTIGSSTPNFEGTFWEDFLDKGTQLLLPTVLLTLISIASYSRYSRSSMLEVLEQDYVRTARSKGLSERSVITKHAFRNALIPLTTIAAFDFANLIGGAVITEAVFGWNGMGAMFRDGLDTVDPAPVMAFFVVTGTAAVVMNMLADIAYAFLDPRITR